MRKCIITGLGGRGRHWLNICNNHAGVEAVAFVEPMEANKKLAVDAGADASTIHDSIDKALDAAGDIDFVLDVTPPAVHHDIAAATFERKLNLLGEKPLSDNYATAKKVVEQGKAAGVTHMITQNYRFRPTVRTLAGLVADDTIGRPGQVDMRFYMPWADFPGTHYVTEPYMLINDMMVHHFDLMRYVVGAIPVAVTAVSWNHSWGWHKGDAAHIVVFEFEGGLFGTHTSIGCSIGERTSWNGDWRIEGPKGSLSMTNEKIRHAWLHRTDSPIDKEIPAGNFPEGEASVMDEFLAALDEGRQPECNAEDNLHSVAMVFGAIESAKQGRKVAISELG